MLKQTSKVQNDNFMSADNNNNNNKKKNNYMFNNIMQLDYVQNEHNFGK